MTGMRSELEFVTVTQHPEGVAFSLRPLLELHGTWTLAFTTALTKVSTDKYAPDATYEIARNGRTIFVRRDGLKIQFLVPGTTTTVPSHIVRQTTYRKATVRDVFLRLPRTECYSDEDDLAAAAGARPDNHTVYSIGDPANVVTDEVNVLYVMCSDEWFSLGLRIKRGGW